MPEPISSIPAPAAVSTGGASTPANVAVQTGDLAATALAAFKDSIPASGAAAAQALTPTPAVTPAAVPAGAKLPNTLLSDEPVNVAKPGEAAAAVAKEAEVKAAEPVYKLALPESGRLSAEHVAEVEKFAKTHGLSEAQAKQILARDDLGVANAFDQARDVLLADPTLGGRNIDQTIATTKRVMQAIWTPEERKQIAAMPMANSRLLHAACAKIAALLPQEDVSRIGSSQPVEKPVSLGQALYPHLYK